ncbi:MAG TPA: prephenate dehydratase domain-containing protein [Syntrophomonadaceae bacterium]|nr:prephenate dehydratase domain-containing protein [Syntrophomonadaceae bacterium]
MICAVLGPSGTFSEEAAHNYWSRKIPLKVANSIDELFEMLEKKEISDLLIPLENSCAGTIETSMINLARYDVSIKGEIYMPIRQHLMASKVYELNEIELLVSQLAVYAQCEEYIKRNLAGARTEIALSTTKAVQIVGDESKKAAAIASMEAAKLYDLHIIDQDIHNQKNITRFIHVSHSKAKLVAADKASLIFSLPDYPGSLSGVLKIFAKYNINLTKIISSPDWQEAETYSFYVDIDIKGKINALNKLLKELQLKGVKTKYLGAYNTLVQS